jgi:membrane protease YdiL (CAAX protease family)
MKFSIKKFFLALEFVLLFFGLPVFLVFYERIIHPSILLLPILLALFFYFKANKEFKVKDLVRLNIKKRTWLIQSMLILIVAILLGLSVYIFDRENLFNLPKGNIRIWLGMLFFYPIFSAYGQEIVYRKFFFMRYKELFLHKWILILLSALAFSFVHIVYFSILSLVLTFFAGIYLGIIYDRTQSVLFNAILHGIVGFMIFTVGLGQHFWLDMMDYL